MSRTIAIKNISGLYHRSLFRLVEAHYGSYVINPGVIYIILPTNIDEIRDQVMNKIFNESSAIPHETPLSIAQEKHLTKILLQQTILTQNEIQDTIQFIKEAHKGQVRYSGEPYYIHPMAVAEILLEETTDPDTILASLLHDVVEDTEVSLSYLHSKYGSTVLNIVAGVTHMANTFRKKKLSKIENELKLQCTTNIHSVQIKLADRLHNVMTLKYRTRENQLKVAQQTIDFYIPFGEKMGVQKITNKLKVLCQEILKSNSDPKN